jgi:hypothetical protein
MTAKRFWRPFVIASLVASIGLLAAPVGPSVTWAASAAATSEPQPLTVQTPTTLDSYLAYMDNQGRALSWEEVGLMLDHPCFGYARKGPVLPGEEVV